MHYMMAEWIGGTMAQYLVEGIHALLVQLVVAILHAQSHQLLFVVVLVVVAAGLLRYPSAIHARSITYLLRLQMEPRKGMDEVRNLPGNIVAYLRRHAGGSSPRVAL